MNFENLNSVIEQVILLVKEKLPTSETEVGKYRNIKYPKLISLMNFDVKRYYVAGFGNVFFMYTRAMFGLMQLATIAFTPNEGCDVPLLLIDIMAMKKKKAVFVEYYDTTKKNLEPIGLLSVKQKYQMLDEYIENEAWYIKERTKYSLIKTGQQLDKLLQMINDSVLAYLEVIKENTISDQKNIEGLNAFIKRMINEGNPSSSTMEKVLGAKEARYFFEEYVMPSVPKEK